MFIFVTCDVSPFAGFAWFLARAVLNTPFYGRPWPAVYINFVLKIHQIQVLTEPLCRAQAAEQRAGYQISWVNLQREAELSVNL